MAALTRRFDLSSEKAYVALRAIGWQVNVRSYSWSPPTDVYETEASFVVRVEVAGMRESDFAINVDRNFLLISGVRPDSPDRRAYHQMEIRFGEFSTAIELPLDVDVDRVEAEYQDGFLSVIFPKSKAKKISIKG
jgi:HSP20 family molecular chaperone IbpA